MTKQSLFCILFLVVTSDLCFAQDKKQMVYKSITELPTYLKSVKPTTNKSKPTQVTLTKPLTSGHFTIINRKTATKNIKVMLPGLYAPGMNQEYSIHASRFTNNNGQVVLLAPQSSGNSRPVYVLKVQNEYKNFISPPVDLAQYNTALLHMGWKVTTNADGTFYFANKIWNGRLGIDHTNQVKILPENERSLTKWIAYQHGWCNNAPIWLYNSSNRSFLGRKVVNDKISFVAVKAADAIGRKIPAGVELAWDFTTFKTYMRGNIDPQMNSFAKFLMAHGNDRDGDGVDAVECGGNDCNDADGDVYPGKVEIADYRNPGKDDDCDPRTYGQRDADGDGYFDNTYYNVDARGQKTGGTDCDDSNPAIIPGAVKYISETQVEVCGLGIYNVEAGMKAIRQPNGTAVVVPK
jgi:hypothetical protein